MCETSFTIACDVNNPFYGSRGAAAVYAPQKGASPDEVDFLEKGMIHYAQVIKETRQMDISEIPGAGAAGGLGGGVLPFLNAELQSGIDIVLDMLRFRETIQGADLIFTGEGNGQSIGRNFALCERGGGPGNCHRRLCGGVRNIERDGICQYFFHTDGSGFFAGGNGSGFCFEEYKAGRHTDYANHSNRNTWIVR